MNYEDGKWLRVYLAESLRGWDRIFWFWNFGTPFELSIILVSLIFIPRGFDESFIQAITKVKKLRPSILIIA